MSLTKYMLSVLVLLGIINVTCADEISPIHWTSAREPGGGGWVVGLAVSPHDSNRVIATGDMLSAALSTDRGLSWEPALGFSSYEMCDVTWHPTNPDIVWMGSLTGPYISTDGGKNWQSRRNGMPEPSYGYYSCPIEKVLFVPGESNHLLAISGSSRHWDNVRHFRGIWESHDHGNTWTFISNITTEGITHAPDKLGLNIYRATFAGNDSHALYVVTDSSIWMSKDLGKNWQITDKGLPHINSTAKRTSIAPIGNIQAHPTNHAVLWISVRCYPDKDGTTWNPGGIFKTTDAGNSWQNISSNLTQDSADKPEHASSYNSLAVSPQNPDILWTGDASYLRCLIYKSEDGGKNWKPVVKKGTKSDKNESFAIVQTACFAGSGMTGFVADPSDDNTLFCWGSEYILRTLDGGQTWIDAMSFQPNPANQNTWRGRGWTGWCSRHIAYNPYRKNQCILQGMDASRGWLTDDLFKTYRYVSTDPVPWMAGNDTSFTEDGSIYITTGQFGGFAGIISSYDFGMTFTTYCGKNHGLPEMSWGGHQDESFGIYANPKKSQHVWATIGGKLYSSVDAGKNWKISNDELSLTTIAGDPLISGRFYTAGKHGIYVFENGVLTNIGGPRPAGRARLNCDSLGRLYACQFRDGRSGLWRYTPSLKQWERLLDEPLAMECVANPLNPDCLLMVTSQDPYNDYASGNGVWISSDAGKSWHAENQELPMLRCNAAAFNPFNPEQIMVGTYGAGFYMAKWPANYHPKGTKSYTMTMEDKTSAKVWKPDIPGSIKNGSMDQGDTVPEYWTEKFGDVEISRDTKIFKKGPASLRVTSTSLNDGQAYQSFDCKGGEIVNLCGFVKSHGSGNVQVAIQSFSQNWDRNHFEQVQYISDDTDWIEFNKSIKIPLWAARYNILLFVSGDSTGWLDEIFIKP